jgi:hypothetical protein
MIRTLLFATSVIIALCLVSSCATTLSPAAAKVQTADSNMVSNCKFIGTMFGSSGMTGVARSIGADNARNDVLEQAAAKGATHVVWEGASDDYWGPNARGNAYKCVK